MRFILPVAVLFISFVFSSCQKEFSVDSSQLTAGGTGTGVSSTNNGCKDCIYYPICSGSVYNYSDTSSGSSTATSSGYTLTYIKDTSIESKTYKKFSVSGQQNGFFNCTSGVSTAIVLNGSTQGGILLPYVKITTLKENAAVGTSWSDTITLNGQDAVYTYTIVSKGTGRTVAGTTYADVIHVHEQTTLDLMGTVIPAGQSEYYFAKGIGLIESLSIDDFTGTQLLHHVLISASIP